MLIPRELGSEQRPSKGSAMILEAFLVDQIWEATLVDQIWEATEQKQRSTNVGASVMFRGGTFSPTCITKFRANVPFVEKNECVEGDVPAEQVGGGWL